MSFDKYQKFLSGILLWIALSVRAEVFINELMPVNARTLVDENGETGDWIELYNSGPADLDLAGFLMTDDAGQPSRWRFPEALPDRTTIPARGYLLVWADGLSGENALHANFKLSGGGETVFLIGTDGKTVIDRIDFGEAQADVSFARFPDGYGPARYCIEPTPGSANASGFSQRVTSPALLPVSGFYRGSVILTALSPGHAAHIVYTLNGSDPAADSDPYTGPVEQTANGIFKARILQEDRAFSAVETRHYFIDTRHVLPVFSIATDPDNLFGAERGIYVHFDSTGREWEREAHLDFFRNGESGFEIRSGIRIQGNSSVGMAKKSFRLFFRDGYGSARLDYPLFLGDPVQSFNSLVLRSGYDEDLTTAEGTLIRDPFLNELWRRTGFLTSQGKLAVLYINGVFWGIYEIRENIDEQFYSDHVRPAETDWIRYRWEGWELKSGDDAQWRSLLRFFDENSFEEDVLVEQAAARMDLENYTTLQAFGHCAQYRSWYYGASAFREKREGAKWIWTVWDMDRAYTELGWNGFDYYGDSQGVYWNNTFIRKLLQNEKYRIRFINRICDLLNTLFEPSYAKALLDSLSEVIRPEIPGEADRWTSSVEKWEANVRTLREYVQQRPGIVRDQMSEYFGLADEADLTVDVQGGGNVRIHSIVPSDYPWTGTYFRGVPVEVRAVPDPGYRFIGWSGASVPDDQVLTLSLETDLAIEAVFAPLGEANAELIAPCRLPAGQRLPVVVRIRDQNWEIQPSLQTPVMLRFGGLRPDSTLLIKRGAGTGVLGVPASNDFTLSAGNADVPQSHKTIAAGAAYPVTEYAGTLPAGDLTWDSSHDRIITGNLTVPAGCSLTITAGTWIILKEKIRIEVLGGMTVEGTADEPVVFISESASLPWGGVEFRSSVSSFQYCFFVNGGGDASRGYPTNDGWHTGRQHILFGREDCELDLDQCFFLNSPGKAFGVQDSRVSVKNSVSSFVWHGGEFHRVFLSYRNSHLMNLPNDDHVYVEDIDTDGFHIDYVNPRYPTYSVIDRCWFVTGKDDAVDHHHARLTITNCWFEDFVHEGLAASGGDTIRIFNTIATGCGQGFEAGWTEDGLDRGPFVFIDHCVAVDNEIGLRIGDSYSWSYRNSMKVTNSVLYGNDDNIWNYLNSTNGPLEGALEISYSMTNDTDYDASPFCITGQPLFDEAYYLLPGSPGAGMALMGADMGRSDSLSAAAGPVRITEVMYNASPERDSDDWVELFNASGAARDLSGWILKDESDSHAFFIPDGTVLPENGYRVFCIDSSAFDAVYPDVARRTGNLNFGLGRDDEVRLFTPEGVLADNVDYSNQAPWPALPDGNGYSLSLRDPSGPERGAAAWTSSNRPGGTPAAPNFTASGVADAPSTPASFVLYPNYPNPFNGETVIRYRLQEQADVTLTLYDMRGRCVRVAYRKEKQTPGLHNYLLQAHGLPSGLYVLRLERISGTGISSAARKIVLAR
ncbi:CotH kinase family protein [bacterium]|nr:CotH kinase family protein [bacterium]